MKILLVLSLLSADLIYARIIRIPADYPAIQQGLNAANSGDTVLVSPQTYVENITWPGVDGIRLVSVAGASTTIIDGDTSGSVIALGSGITNRTVIDGFTIRDGKATVGGGIRLNEAAPIISRNRIYDNRATGSSYSHGGGIYCSGTSGASPQIVANHIKGNKVVGTNWNYGGGIYISRNSRATVTYNTIEQDSAIGGYWNYGAGIYCDMDSRPVIFQNLIRANAGQAGDRAHGVGVYVNTRAFPSIFNNLIVDNRASSGSWNYGAGIRADSGVSIVNNTIANNVCAGGIWNNGGGIFLDGINNYVYNNIIVGNQGGGIYNYDRDSTQIIDYNDVWNNSPTNYYNCRPGSNDRSRDPSFCAGSRGDFYLSQILSGQPIQSPCVDSGGVLNDSLLSIIRQSTTRTDSVPDSGNVDMGYHYPIGQPVWIDEGTSPGSVLPGMTLVVFPTPFRHALGIRLFAPSGLGASVKIYDISGRCVRTVFDGLCPTSDYLCLGWPGDDDAGRQLPQGIYIVRLVTGQRFLSRKAILVK